MGKNAQRRRGKVMLKSMLRRILAPAPLSAIRSQEFQEARLKLDKNKVIPNRAERRGRERASRSGWSDADATAGLRKNGAE